MSMKFSKTKGTEELLKLTKFDVVTLIFGDIRPQQYLEKQPKYGKSATSTTLRCEETQGR